MSSSSPALELPHRAPRREALALLSSIEPPARWKIKAQNPIDSFLFRMNCGILIGKGVRFLNIDHLRYFLVLSQEMHYSRAAQRLNISQSGLSHAIAALEQELGVSLFQKSGRGIALGRYGAALLSQAQQIVALADSCLRHFQMLRRGWGPSACRPFLCSSSPP